MDRQGEQDTLNHKQIKIICAKSEEQYVKLTKEMREFQ